MPSTNSTNSTIAMMMPAQNRNLAIPIAAPVMRAKPAAAPDATLSIVDIV